MNIPTTLLTIEAGGVYDLLDHEEQYDVASYEMTDEVTVICGTITVFP